MVAQQPLIFQRAHLDVDILLRTRLEELYTQLFGELPAPFVADDPLVLHVALIPD